MKEEGLMPNKGGTPCVLPSSHIGSPRHMYEIYQDSMEITRFNHHPDLFLTMTANPKWPEIQDALLEHQHACDRPDIVAGVFEFKRKALMEENSRNGGYHMHLLIFLEKSEKIRTVEQVDKYVLAEFPDENEDSILFDTVRKCMVHGSCGERNPEAPCMRKGKCTKNYPKKYNDTTCLDSGGYPVYLRRDDGREVIVRNGRYDKTTVVVGAKDEVQMYIDARYIGPPEDSFDSLKTVNGQLCPTFKKACIELGLLKHDGEWLPLLEEAADIQTGSQLRKLFKIVLSDCNPTEPEIL
ncbi:uncharacterized protein LOC113305391 [Papaver somniferum]|uniref:uncharacterized protein LOC113305391 n=1 Tax=Papaver somniferum TaxID=3469 RepID=UPI000E701EBA|nr:uncharacterized protein LOC113305391 [Papaver somniferum]